MRANTLRGSRLGGSRTSSQHFLPLEEGRQLASPERNGGWLPDMKKIEAIIKPFKLEEVKSGLAELGIEGMTVSEVKGYGNPIQSSRPPYAPSRLPFIPKLKVELIVKNELLGSAVAAIKQSARTGTRGDGKIFVQDLLQVIRIRTEERGDRAI
jgi:nitrogen regulatory protein P-II 1